MRKALENPKVSLMMDYLLIVLGSCVFASGIAIFIKPAMISMGGVAGIALIGNYLTGLPLGVASIVLNVPLFIFGYKLLGREFFFKTIVSSVSYSLFIDIVGPFLPLFRYILVTPCNFMRKPHKMQDAVFAWDMLGMGDADVSTVG